MKTRITDKERQRP